MHKNKSKNKCNSIFSRRTPEEAQSDIKMSSSRANNNNNNNAAFDEKINPSNAQLRSLLQNNQVSSANGLIVFFSKNN